MKWWHIGPGTNPEEPISSYMAHRLRFIKILQWVGGPFIYLYSAYFLFIGFYFAAAMILMAGLTVSIGSFWIFRSASQERSLLIYQVIVALFFL